MREVRAPKVVQKQVDVWVVEMSKFIINCSLPKVSPSTLSHLPTALPPSAKYPGASLLSCTPTGALLSNSLVFPSASATLQVNVKFAKQPNCSATMQEYLSSCLAQLVSQLSSCPLLASDSLQYQLSLFSSWPTITFRPAGKLGKHLTVELCVAVEMPAWLISCSAIAWQHRSCLAQSYRKRLTVCCSSLCIVLLGCLWTFGPGR